MSARQVLTEWTVWCDRDICTAWTGEGDGLLTRTDARRVARSRGWSTHTGYHRGDFCPEHKRQEPCGSALCTVTIPKRQD